jgi:hypothetical protein
VLSDGVAFSVASKVGDIKRLTSFFYSNVGLKVFFRPTDRRTEAGVTRKAAPAGSDRIDGESLAAEWQGAIVY